MIGFLRAILEALGHVLENQKTADLFITDFKRDMDETLKAQGEAIEHLRVLIEGDELPAAVGVPTFQPTGGITK